MSPSRNPEKQEMRDTVKSVSRAKIFYSSVQSIASRGLETRAKSGEVKTRIAKLVCVNPHLERHMPEIRTQKQALAEARRLLGKDAAIRYDRNAGIQSDREAANRALVDLRATKPMRHMDADAWEAWKAEHSGSESHLVSVALGYRCTVGCVIHSRIGSYYRICGQGDSWEQALARATKHA